MARQRWPEIRRHQVSNIMWSSPFFKPAMKNIFIYSLLLLSTAATANEADVINVKTKCFKECTFFVTVKHQDKGWDHYANRWEVVTLDGDLIATRTLLHPHVNEQPFMRSLSNVKIPAGTNKVIVRAHDSVHGYGGKTIEVRVVYKPD